jgi:hypothetical protein
MPSHPTLEGRSLFAEEKKEIKSDLIVARERAAGLQYFSLLEVKLGGRKI